MTFSTSNATLEVPSQRMGWSREPRLLLVEIPSETMHKDKEGVQQRKKK